MTKNTTKIELTQKDKFNALSNAVHIKAFEAEQIPFKLLEVVETASSIKAIIQLESGEIKGLFTDSKSAMEALKEVSACFGADCPFMVIKIRETSKGMSVYYAEVK